MADIKNTNDSELMSFKFNLPPDHSHESVKGRVILEKEDIVVTVDDKEEKRIKTKDILELVVDFGVGCRYVSYKLKSDESIHFLCRVDSKLSKRTIKAVRKMNLYLEDGTLPPKGKEEAEKCPKCGKPYRPGSSVCLHCTDKRKIISRLWGFVKKYKLFVFLSIVMFFFVSGLRLLEPYANRIIVDDFI